MNNLGLLYKTEGRFSLARPYFERALSIKRHVLGPDHPDVASVLNNLASLYRAEGALLDAEFHYQQALTLFEQVLGREHPRVGSVLNNRPSYMQTAVAMEKRNSRICAHSRSCKERLVPTIRML